MTKAQIQVTHDFAATLALARVHHSVGPKCQRGPTVHPRNLLDSSYSRKTRMPPVARQSVSRSFLSAFFGLSRSARTTHASKPPREPVACHRISPDSSPDPPRFRLEEPRPPKRAIRAHPLPPGRTWSLPSGPSLPRKPSGGTLSSRGRTLGPRATVDPGVGQGPKSERGTGHSKMMQEKQRPR